MKKTRMLPSLAVAAVAALLCVAMPGCGSTDKADAAVSPGALCDGCGEEKGDAKCCAEGMETCSGCGKHKGSPGCCK